MGRDAGATGDSGRRRRRGPRKLLVLGGLAGAVALYRQQRLDAADAAFPEASTRP